MLLNPIKTQFATNFLMVETLQEKLSFATWFMTRLLVMEDIYDYMTM
jgi:hypothetical protein